MKIVRMPISFLGTTACFMVPCRAGANRNPIPMVRMQAATLSRRALRWARDMRVLDVDDEFVPAGPHGPAKAAAVVVAAASAGKALVADTSLPTFGKTLVYFLGLIVLCGHLLWYAERGKDAMVYDAPSILYFAKTEGRVRSVGGNPGQDRPVLRPMRSRGLG